MTRYLVAYDDPTLGIPGVRRVKGFLIRDGDVGRRTIILAEDRVDRTVEFMEEEGYRSLEINYVLGHPSKALDCLSRFRFLRGFAIIHRKVQDIKAIHQLDSLRKLSIQTHCATRINFDAFTNLKYCRVFWRPGAISVFECSSLSSLFLDYYKAKEISRVTRLRELSELTITNSPLEDISPLRDLQPLRHLTLINLRKLGNLDALTSQRRLEQLRIDGSRNIGRIDAVRRMMEMRVLNLCNAGVVRSLSPLANLNRLEELYFNEDTTIEDGNLNILLELPSLRRVAFANRRHYSHSCEEIEAIIESRGRRNQ